MYIQKLTRRNEMKITRYTDQYLSINGVFFLGIHAIQDDRVLLHFGCPESSDVCTVVSGEKYSTDKYGLSFMVDVDTDGNGDPICTIHFEGENIQSIVRMEEIEDGAKLQ
jgi:hypothetical protein